SARGAGHPGEDRLFAHLREDVRDAVAFLLKSGWRRNEVLKLRWSDCRLEQKQALTKIKGGDIETRALSISLIEIIKRQPKVSPFVFTYVCEKSKPAYTDKRGRKHPARRKGERYPLTATALRKPFAAALIAAEILSFRLH